MMSSGRLSIDSRGTHCFISLWWKATFFMDLGSSTFSRSRRGRCYRMRGWRSHALHIEILLHWHALRLFTVIEAYMGLRSLSPVVEITPETLLGGTRILSLLLVGLNYTKMRVKLILLTSRGDRRGHTALIVLVMLGFLICLKIIRILFVIAIAHFRRGNI